MTGNRGFTLLEALITSIIFFICISITVMAFTAGSRNFSSSKETIKGFQDTQNILEMITSELREAFINASFNLSSNQVTFQKFNRPSGEIQTITWKYLSAEKAVKRSYTSSLGNTGALMFGKNIEDLSFSEANDMRNSVPYKKVTVAIQVLSRRQSAAHPREIISLEKSINLRHSQEFQADIMFTD
jgi:type II secretory pathway pseudopilin PulG